MDPLTHALASYTLKRAAFPRLARPATIAMVVAGTVGDLDLLSAHVGPSAYITWSHTFCHSLLMAIVFSLLAAAAIFFLGRRKAPAQTTRGRYNFGERDWAGVVFVAALAASLLHLFFDLCQAQGVELLWPFARRRFALDWVAHLDLLILGVFIAALVLPKLASLVSEEIGAKAKGPRGRGAAIAALTALLLYICFRASLHSAAITALDSRTYRGEAPLRVAAFPETNMLNWNGVVETERAIREVPVPSFSAASFDPDSARTIYKPDPSPALDAALKTATALRFIAYARFPCASIEKTPDGYRVRLQTYPFDPDFRIQALIDVSPTAQILTESLSYDFGAQQR